MKNAEPVEKWRQDPDQDDLRRHGHLRDAGRKPEHQAAEHEQDRVRDAQRAREDQKDGSRDQQRQELELLLGAEVGDHAEKLRLRRGAQKSRVLRGVP